MIYCVFKKINIYIHIYLTLQLRVGLQNNNKAK